MKALLLVDLQNDFLPGGALAVADGDAVIPVANRLQPLFPRVYATKDWHPRDHASFAANHPGHAVGDRVEVDGLEQILWPVHCVQGSPGAELAPGLDTAAIDKVFYKGVDAEVDSYSAFYDNAERRSTGLGEHLRAAGVDEVYILGLATDYCVNFSVHHAIKLGFTTYVVADGCRGVDLAPGDSARALEAMRAAGARVVESAEVARSLVAAAAPIGAGG